MKAIKILVILAVVYVGVVVVFESLLGYFQPTSEATLVISTFEADGTQHDRVVTRINSDDQLYVAVNHWPRAWFHRALDNPAVEISIDGETGPYNAVQIEGDEFARVDAERPLGPIFRILTGFPPRHIMRLDPQT
ncbi:MAG: hypothetical protein AAF993_03580 [Pseudomonadota bacterium]